MDHAFYNEVSGRYTRTLKHFYNILNILYFDIFWENHLLSL